MITIKQSTANHEQILCDKLHLPYRYIQHTEVFSQIGRVWYSFKATMPLATITS